MDIFTLVDAETQGEERNAYHYIVKQSEKVFLEDKFFLIFNQNIPIFILWYLIVLFFSSFQTEF